MYLVIGIGEEGYVTTSLPMNVSLDTPPHTVRGMLAEAFGVEPEFFSTILLVQNGKNEPPMVVVSYQHEFYEE